jgi:hypothetical protein
VERCSDIDWREVGEVNPTLRTGMVNEITVSPQAVEAFAPYYTKGGKFKKRR